MKNSISIVLLILISLATNSYAQNRTIIDDPININFDTISLDYKSHDFKSPVSFFWTKMQGVNFYQSIFYSEVDFKKSVFSGKTIFDDVNFQSKTIFKNTIFNSEIDFSRAAFASELIFENAKFKSIVKFNETVFNGDANFNEVTFGSKVEFYDAEFNGDANFNEAIFDSIAAFNSAEFNSDIDFTSASLPMYLDFSNVTKISNEINLTRSIIPDSTSCYISITGADIDKIKFRFQRFKLWFKEEDSIGYELKSNVYEELLKKQNDEGFTQSYEKLDKEYREFKYTNIEGSQIEIFWGRFQNWIDKKWWGYGYNKELIVLNSILLYLLFSLINVFFLKHLTIRVYEAEKINEYWEEARGSKTSKFLRSIPFSLFYTAQIFFGFKFDVEKLKYKENLQGWKIFNLVYFITIYLSGLVCFAYLANYVVTI